MLKACLIAITAIIFALQFKTPKSEYATYISFMAGLIIIFMVVSKLMQIKEGLSQIEKYIDINADYLLIIIKIIGISYIADIISTMCEEAGFKTISGQIEIMGKLSILTASVPILISLLKTITSM